MCGIIGYTGKNDSITITLEGLKRLEYRGYDSVGIAYFENGAVDVRRCKGKIGDLMGIFANEKHSSHTTIGHTRWATHGKPSTENAHPHRSGGIVLVHNGIVENYVELKNKLKEDGFVFTSETDTEIICHLISKYAESRLIEDAVREAVKELRGAYALAVISEKEPGKIVGVRKDSPLVVGVGDGEYFVASDIPAFLGYTRDVVFLEDDELVVLTQDGYSVSKTSGELVNKDVVHINWNSAMAEKGGYRHFMLKEIFEQPRAIADTLAGRLNVDTGEVNIEEFHITPDELKIINKVFIVACGTSWHAAITGKYMIEELARVPVEVDIASEFRYRNPIIKGEELFIAITQSGETADTLAAQRIAKKLGAKVLTICNVIGSTASREADSVFYTHSGPEIGVASTKAFTAQITALYLFAVALGHTKGLVTHDRMQELLKEVLMVPDKIEKAILNEGLIEQIAKTYVDKTGFLYIGRGINYPIALEGALKLKEISYIHAEAYPAGEMKHGPIALINEGFPVIALAPKESLYEKLISNVQEIKSRGGRIIAVTAGNAHELAEMADHTIEVPETIPFLQPMLLAIPLQLLAYHIGVLRGCDVDQPRNLAKSVTVE
jgi:glucosamine--fructose-6-phosphate aminotransferase (isomerizing)